MNLRAARPRGIRGNFSHQEPTVPDTLPTRYPAASRGESQVKSVSQDITGNRHDKYLYDITQTYCRGPDGTAAKVKTKGDLGYEGTACDLPVKKPKSRPLMMHEKYQNRQHAKQRIGVEHEIAHLQQFQILGQRFRHNPKRHNLIFRNIAGLRNLIQASPA